jgi:hypothetical protein
MTKKYIFISFLILALTSVLSAQQMTGNIEGRFLNSDGNPLQSVNIVASSPSLQGTKGTTSGRLGYFRLVALPPGTYRLNITHISYHELIIEDVIVSLGKTVSVGNFKMTLKSLETPEVVVQGERSLIDLHSTSLGTNLKASEFESLPLGRNYREIAALLPQANTSPYGDEVNISGGTGWENKYFIDGLDVSDTHEGSIETNIPYNFVKEVQLISGGYAAEYKSSLGGLVNVITYSGGNEVHGSVFGFYTANWLSSSPNVGLADPADGPFSNYDAGFGIGGPIVKDKLWYYGAYNPTFNRRDVVLPGLRKTYTDKTVTHSFAVKLTWKPLQQLNLVFTSTGDPAERTAIGFITGVFTPPTALLNEDPYLSTRKTGGVNLSLAGNYTIGDYLLFDASISRINREEIDEPSTERGKNEVMFVDTTGEWSGGFSYNSSQKREVTGIKLNTTLIAGDHILKAGAEYNDNQLNLDLGYSFLFPDFPPNPPYYIYGQTQRGIVHNRTPSIYVQDTWTISRKFRLNAGIRWSSQFLAGSNGLVDQKIYGPIQPRVGFIFLPDEDGTQKIFGSFGRFTQDLQTGLLANQLIVQNYLYIIEYNTDPRPGNVTGDSVLIPGKIPPEIPGLQGQYYDEFSLGYERMISSKIKVGVKGIYRTLREAIEECWFPSEGGVYKYGNPGKGPLADFPKAQRDYTALVLTIEKHNADRFNFVASYVLSRNYGNYPGVFDYFNPLSFSNSSRQFDDIESLKNGTGLLPNDRTHSFKFIGSYRMGNNFITGLSFQWSSGTPLSRLARVTQIPEPFFLEPRGTAGRTASIWDLNARIIFVLPAGILSDARLIFDIFHILSQREPIQYVEEQYFNVDQNGNGIFPNPNYGTAFRYQKPMSVRLGMEVNF